MRKLFLLLILPLAVVALTGCSSGDSSGFAGTAWVYYASSNSDGENSTEAQTLVFQSSTLTHTWKETVGGIQINYGKVEAPYTSNGDTFTSVLSHNGTTYTLSGTRSGSNLNVNLDGVVYRTFKKN